MCFNMSLLERVDVCLSQFEEPDWSTDLLNGVREIIQIGVYFFNWYIE